MLHHEIELAPKDVWGNESHDVVLSKDRIGHNPKQTNFVAPLQRYLFSDCEKWAKDSPILQAFPTVQRQSVPMEEPVQALWLRSVCKWQVCMEGREGPPPPVLSQFRGLGGGDDGVEEGTRERGGTGGNVETAKRDAGKDCRGTRERVRRTEDNDTYCDDREEEIHPIVGSNGYWMGDICYLRLRRQRGEGLGRRAGRRI